MIEELGGQHIDDIIRDLLLRMKIFNKLTYVNFGKYCLFTCNSLFSPKFEHKTRIKINLA